MDTTQEVRLVCKHCGSDEIVSREHLLCSASIAGWSRDESGKPVPEWSGDTAVHWDTQEAVDEAKPYECRRCDAALGDDELADAPEVAED